MLVGHEWARVELRMLIGHEWARVELEKELPPVTLLLGPPSTGKHRLAQYIAEYSGAHVTEQHDFGRLTSENARAIISTAERAPFGPHRVFIIDLDGATVTAQNAMLKMLEEPPSTVRFILVASSQPLTTILSRSRVFRLGVLTDAEVMQVLEARGASAEDAAFAAPAGRGRVQPALDALGAEASQGRAVVSAAVKAAMTQNMQVLASILRGWTPGHTAMLSAWATEVASGRRVVFGSGFAPGVTPREARTVLRVLSRYPGSRTAVAVALHRAFQGRDT